MPSSACLAARCASNEKARESRRVSAASAVSREGSRPASTGRCSRRSASCRIIRPVVPYAPYSIQRLSETPCDSTPGAPATLLSLVAERNRICNPPALMVSFVSNLTTGPPARSGRAPVAHEHDAGRQRRGLHQLEVEPLSFRIEPLAVAQHDRIDVQQVLVDEFVFHE